MSGQSYIPAPLSGFEHINRYWDHSQQISAAKINPGEYYVTDKVEVITTILGSCIGVCVHDPDKKVGGMNHFSLPSKTLTHSACKEQALEDFLAYGVKMMNDLVNAVVRLTGNRDGLVFKIFGCADLDNSDVRVGERNLAFIDRFMSRADCRLKSYDVRGNLARKLLFYPETGTVYVKLLPVLPNETLLFRERDYITKLNSISMSGIIQK